MDDGRLLVPGDGLPAELGDPVSERDAGVPAGAHRSHRQPGLRQLGGVPAHGESPDRRAGPRPPASATRRTRREFTVQRLQQADGSLLFPITTATAEASRTTPMAEPRVSVHAGGEHVRELAEGLPRRRLQPASGLGRAGRRRSIRKISTRTSSASKSELFERKLRLNLATFYVKYTDMQLPSVFVDANNAVTFLAAQRRQGAHGWRGARARSGAFRGLPSRRARWAISVSSTRISAGPTRTTFSTIHRREPTQAQREAERAERPLARSAGRSGRRSGPAISVRSTRWGSREQRFDHLPGRCEVPVAGVLLSGTTSSARARAYTLVDANIGWTATQRQLDGDAARHQPHEPAVPEGRPSTSSSRSAPTRVSNT